MLRVALGCTIAPFMHFPIPSSGTYDGACYKLSRCSASVQEML